MIEEKNSFPSLDELVNAFYKNNKPFLRMPYSKIETHGGLIIYSGRGSLILLSVHTQGPMGKNSLQPYLGGNGQNMYTTEENNYRLSGRLNYRSLHLETTITKTQDYLMEEIKDINYTNRLPVKNGEPSLTIRRKDNFPYWFITEPNKKDKC